MKKKITLLGALLVTTAMQAQTFYWPDTRVSELTSGTQYFIYNTAYSNGDRSWFLFSDGSALKTNNASPKDFVTSENKYIFTLTKPASPLTANHWYMNSVHGIVGIGGQTNNTETRDLYITPWFGNNVITKGNAQSEDEDGNLQNPDEVDTKVFAITSTGEANTSGDQGYAWNGDAMSAAGEGSAWTGWSAAHPYAFYSVESKTIDPAAYAAYQELTAPNGKLEELAFDLQNAFGLVQDGSKYYCNYKESTEGSYEGLVDGNDKTYFHSSWSASGTDADPRHYLEARLSDATQGFYIITKRRMDNNNNRPTRLLVEGSTRENGDYTEIATLEGLPTAEDDYFYFSDKITSPTAYRYLRFTPLVTNNNTRFFTYSEFYVINATPEADAAMRVVKSLYDCKNLSPKDETFEQALLDAGKEIDAQSESLGLMVGKIAANELLEDNANNYSDDPELGAYPTAAYNALKTAVEESRNADELAAAVKAFRFSINAPVFMINGAGQGTGYSTVGKSIYYNPDNKSNPLGWNKASNKYDKTMLWKLAGLTNDIPDLNTSYSAMNLSAPVYLWDIESMQITQTEPENENGQVLIKTAGFENPLHADAGGSIVRWGTFTENSASAWTLEYVGESKNIEKISDEQLAAYAELEKLVTSCLPFKGKIGTGLNQFTSANFESALVAAEKIVDQDIYANPDWVADITTVKADLEAAKEALKINQPETGKFYRIKSVSMNKYVSSTPITYGRESLIDTADATTVFYLSDDNRLTNSIAVNLNKDILPDSCSMGTTFEFLVNNNGYYMIKSADREEPLYPHNDKGDLLTYDFNGGNYADRLADAWILEEVTDPAEQPKLTKSMTTPYATMAAPVALNIPAGVAAYTVKVDGEAARMTEITGNVIPAGVPVLITGTEGLSYDFTFAPSGTTDNANDLLGVYTDSEIPEETAAYVLGNGEPGAGFYLMESDNRTLSAHNAYLPAPAEAADVKVFVLNLEDLTGIESVATGTEAEEYYDLQGRRVTKPTKGIYVTKSGKKVIFMK